MHCFDKTKVKWLNVFVAACRGQISMGTCGSACTGGVSGAGSDCACVLASE